METTHYVVARLDSLYLSSTAQYYGKLVLEHILHNIACSTFATNNRLDHQLAIDFFANNELYYTNVDSEILSDLIREEQYTAHKLAVQWLTNTRGMFPDTLLTLDFFLTDVVVGVRYV